ncbi:MAG: ketol-acid reductoisomerase, partial [Chloroflexi bacterium]|nr:ketol-acid reductoisomerase [Chloroflexota bacterium]
EYGDLTRGPKIIDDSVKQRMQQILSDIQDGTFAREWIMENQTGRPGFDKLRARAARHESEEVGAELRGMMSWLNEEAD